LEVIIEVIILSQLIHISRASYPDSFLRIFFAIIIPMDKITFEEFQKLDLRAVTILEAKKIPQTKKLLKLILDDGKEERQIVASIGNQYSIRELEGKQIIILANLETKEFFGEESQGMLLAAEGKKIALLTPDKPVPTGTKVD